MCLLEKNVCWLSFPPSQVYKYLYMYILYTYLFPKSVQALNSFGAQPGSQLALGGGIKNSRRVVGVVEGGNQLQNLLSSDPEEGCAVGLGDRLGVGVMGYMFEEGWI